MLLTAAVMLVTVVLAACSGGTSATPTPVPTETPVAAKAQVSPEGALQQRAEAAIAALSAGEWEEYYQYQSPSLRRRRFPYGLELVQPCLAGKFSIEMDAAMARLRDSLGIEDDELLRLAVNRVAVEELRGRVYVDMFYNGELVDVGGEETGAPWELIDGVWWREDLDIGRCPELGFGGGQDVDDS